METRTLTQLSPSKLTAYMTCPIKFYARYILGIKSPPSAGPLLGRAVHKALELLGRRRHGIPTPGRDRFGLPSGVASCTALLHHNVIWTAASLRLSPDAFKT